MHLGETENAKVFCVHMNWTVKSICVYIDIMCDYHYIRTTRAFLCCHFIFRQFIFLFCFSFAFTLSVGDCCGFGRTESKQTKPSHSYVISDVDWHTRICCCPPPRSASRKNVVKPKKKLSNDKFNESVMRHRTMHEVYTRSHTRYAQ